MCNYVELRHVKNEEGFISQWEETKRIMKQAIINRCRLSLLLCIICLVLAACDITISAPPGSSFSGNPLSTQTVGPGVQGVQVFVEPDAGVHVITDAIDSAQKSVWVEIYLLTNKQVISSLEEAANRGLDVRVMLEPHPYGGGSISPTETMDRLKAAGIKVQTTNPDFKLTHEKAMIIDNKTAFILTPNFTQAALGGSSSTKNREYGIIDSRSEDVQAVSAIFQADWNRTKPQINDPNLVVSPVNARGSFISLIQSAHKTLLIEAEEMQDSQVEQAIATAAQNGVDVRVILPTSDSSSSDSNSDGIATIKQGGVHVREDHKLYMHAKIIVVDGKKAFVGSENISTQSLDSNRELGILLSDQQVLQTLQQTFEQDWSASQSV